MSFEIAFNPPQFLDQYDGTKMRQLVEELERLHAALTSDVDDEGEPGFITSFNGRVGDVVPVQADYDSFFLTPSEGDAAYLRLDGTNDPITGNLTINAALDVNGALTATTYGGIAEANLLDKTALETVTGGWTFSGTLSIPQQAVIDHEAAIDHDALTNFVSQEHIRWDLTGAEDIHVDRISQASVTQHEAAIDHDALTNFVAAEHIDWSAVGVEDIDAGRITSAAVTQHEAAINHDALTNFVAQEHIRWDLTGAEDIHVDRISETAVTQHEAALTIANTQITGLSSGDLSDVASIAMLDENETITGEWTFENSGDNVIFNKTAFDSGSYLRFNNEAGVLRWRIGEGANTNDNLDIYAYDAGGVFRATAIRFSGLSDDISITWDVDISGALTATSYGGITEANLLDKSAAETVTGSWSITGNWAFDVEAVSDLVINSTDTGSAGLQWSVLDAAVGYIGANTTNILEVWNASVVSRLTLDPSGNLTADGDISGATIGGITEANLLDKSAAESITGAWKFFESANFDAQHGIDFDTFVAVNSDANAWNKSGNYAAMFEDSNNALVVLVGGTLNERKAGIQSGHATHSFAANLGELHLNPLGGATKVGADLDVTGALTAASYGGITEANLLDKTAAETISGAWTFSGNTELGNVDVTGTLDILDSAGAGNTHLNYATGANYITNRLGDATYFREWNGTTNTALAEFDSTSIDFFRPVIASSSIAATGAVTGSNLNVSNWDTAYGWGDHAAAGYAASSHTHTGSDISLLYDFDVYDCRTMPGSDGTTSYFPDPNAAILDKSVTAIFGYDAWAPANWGGSIVVKGWSGGYAAWSLTGPASTTAPEDWYLRSGITTTWNTPRRVWHDGDFSSTDVSNWDTAYGWGDHAAAGYLLDTTDTFTGTLTVSGAVNIDGIVLDEASFRAGLLEVNRDGASSWAGYGIYFSSTAQWCLFGSQTQFGFYDDYNNKWLLRANENSNLELFNNGTSVAETYSTGLRRTSQGSFLHHGSSSYLSGKVTVSTAAPSGGSNGDVWLKY